VRAIRQAISPRLAMRTEENIASYVTARRPPTSAIAKLSNPA
jgi:hypothetical protein